MKVLLLATFITIPVLIWNHKGIYSHSQKNPLPASQGEREVSEITNSMFKSPLDINGKEVMTLVNENQAAGRYSVDFNGSELSSGVYYYKLSATGEEGDFVYVKKMILFM